MVVKLGRIQGAISGQVCYKELLSTPCSKHCCEQSRALSPVVACLAGGTVYINYTDYTVNTSTKVGNHAPYMYTVA